jgi:small subunit ribosomal protein S2
MSEELLIPTEEYLKSGIHIGTKFRSKYMENFIYKTRTDGLSVLNLQKIDERLKVAGKLLANYEPQDIMVVCRRENGWKSIRMFEKATGVRAFPGRYPPGILTNPQLKNFVEAKIVLAVDVVPDKNALKDALVSGIPTIALCDTNNSTNNIDLIVPCNNKGKKSLGLIFWILAKEYMTNKGLLNKGQAFEYSIEDFTDE